MGLEIEVLDRLEPGLGLGEALARIDPAQLSPYDRVVVMKAHQRQMSHHQACVYGEMAAIVSHFLSEGDDYELAHDSASAEIAAALHLTRRAADYEIDVATELADRLPQVAALLAQGRLDLRRVRAFIRGTGHLEADIATGIVDSSLERAERMTAGQLDASCLSHLAAANASNMTPKRRRSAIRKRSTTGASFWKPPPRGRPTC